MSGFHKIVFVFLGLLKFSPPLWAADFSTELSHFSAVCSEASCKTPYSVKTLVRFPQSVDLKLKELLNVADQQTLIWPDTILEADYAADGVTQLDKVDAFYKHKKLVGYEITYSQKAWDTSSCQYDGVNLATLADCKPGRIIESSYVSPDFKEYFTDEKAYAHFQ